MLIRIYPILWLFILCLLSSSQAMLTDGLHHLEDYYNFAQTQEDFSAACYIHDKVHHLQQTGVLIHPRVVMTAAHGVIKQYNLSKEDVNQLIVGFDEYKSMDLNQYPVEKIIIHPNYLRGSETEAAKFDMAFLILKIPVNGIKPVPLFQEETIPEDTLLTVVSFGSSGSPKRFKNQKRAFSLCEFDRFHLSSENLQAFEPKQNVLYGSIFFDPRTLISSVTPFKDTEVTLRTFKAQQRWLKAQKPPISLALPGTSGAPVFANIKGKTVLFGIVSSFSHLSMTSFHTLYGDQEVNHILSSDLKNIYGRYQTVFCLPYQLVTDIKHLKKNVFTLDPDVLKILKEITEGRKE